MKKISILVPTLGDREKELKRLFESIAKQEYKNIEVIIISQGNHSAIKKICDNYSELFDIIFVSTDKKGLARARNIGLKNVTGEIVLLSDDDCWYEEHAFEKITTYFENTPNVDILLSQIYDPINNKPYKNYPTKKGIIHKELELLSKSSIEIAFKHSEPYIEFDELFGLGGKYIAAEENDFLIRSIRNKKVILYEPIITVFHQKKSGKSSEKQLIAKGAFYSKNFGFIVSNLVLLRDLLIKHQNNYRWFWHGYFDYKKQH